MPLDKKNDKHVSWELSGKASYMYFSLQLFLFLASLSHKVLFLPPGSSGYKIDIA